MTIPVLNNHPSRKTGARPPDPARLAKAIKFADIRSAALPTPFNADYLQPLNGKWQMLGNDLAGDCESCRWANHRFQITSTLTDAPHYPSQADVWKVYQTQNPNFDPNGDPSVDGPGSPADGGMDTQTLLEYLHKNGGPDGAKPVAFALVNHTNLAEVQAAVDTFGAVWVDIVVLQGNQDQFDQKTPWTNDGSQVDGGHAVLGGGVVVEPTSETSPLVAIETWAAETSLTQSFWTGHTQDGTPLVSAVWAVIWEENLGTRQFAEGIDAAKLAEVYQATTGKVLPLPTPPTPQPQPTPTPQPTPAPPEPTPGPGAAPFLGCTPENAAAILRAAARKHLDPTEWMNRHFAKYFAYAEAFSE